MTNASKEGTLAVLLDRTAPVSHKSWTEAALPASSSTGKPWSCLSMALDQHWTYNCLVMEPCVTENCLCPVPWEILVPREIPSHVILWLWTNTGATTQGCLVIAPCITENFLHP